MILWSFIYFFILIITIINILLRKNIFPHHIYNVIWCTFGIYIIFQNYTSVYSVIYILVSIIVYNFGFLTFEKITYNHKLKMKKVEMDRKCLINILSVIAIISTFVIWREMGFDIHLFFDLNSLANKMNSIAHMRYNVEGPAISISTRIATIFIYVTSAFLGFYFHKTPKIHIIIFVLISFLILIMLNTKATIINIFFIFISSYFTVYVFENKKYSIKKITRLTCIIVLIFTLVVFVNFLRHNMNLTISEEIEKILTSYIFSTVDAFNYWLSININSIPLISLSGDYFSGLQFFTDKGNGVFVREDSINTNVYTVKRTIIESYGIIGGLIFTFIISSIAGLSVKKVRLQNNYYIGMLITSYLVVLNYFGSIFKYSVNTASIVIILLFFIVFESKRDRLL